MAISTKAAAVYGDYIDVAGVGNIADDANEPFEYFNLQGRRVAEPKAGDIVIRRQGSDVTKVIL